MKKNIQKRKNKLIKQILYTKNTIFNELKNVCTNYKIIIIKKIIKKFKNKENLNN